MPAIAIVKKYEDRFEFFGISQKIPSVLIDLIAEDKLMLRGEKMNLKNIKTSQLEFGKKIIGLP